MKALALEGLQKTYFDPYKGTQVTAVRDVSLRVEPGEFVSVVGPSGCGKTTILNMIAGFLPHTGGRILVDGKPISGPGPDRGVVFQSFALFPWKTVLDNVGFGPKMRGVPRAERDRIAREYLALAGLAHAADRYPADRRARFGKPSPVRTASPWPRPPNPTPSSITPWKSPPDRIGGGVSIAARSTGRAAPTRMSGRWS